MKNSLNTVMLFLLKKSLPVLFSLVTALTGKRKEPSVSFDTFNFFLFVLYTSPSCDREGNCLD